MLKYFNAKFGKLSSAYNYRIINVFCYLGLWSRRKPPHSPNTSLPTSVNTCTRCMRNYYLSLINLAPIGLLVQIFRKTTVSFRLTLSLLVTKPVLHES